MAQIKTSGFKINELDEKVVVPVCSSNGTVLRIHVADLDNGENRIAVGLITENPGGFLLHFEKDKKYYLIPLLQLCKSVAELHERRKACGFDDEEGES